MSEVISFRISKNNSREARALDVLKTRCEEGYSIRYIITMALLRLGDSEFEPKTIALDELNGTLKQVNQLLEQFGTGVFPPMIKMDKSIANSGLTDNFIASINKTAKSGMKLG